MRVFGSFLALLCCALSCGYPVHAQITDRVVLERPNVVVVWGGVGASNEPLVFDLLIDSAGSGFTDRISATGNTVITGTLVSTGGSAAGAAPPIFTNTAAGDLSTDVNGDGVSTLADGLAEFGLTQDTGLAIDGVAARTSFFVASNVAFNIFAEVTEFDVGPALIPGFPGETTTGIEIAYDFTVTQSGTIARQNLPPLTFGTAAQLPNSAGADAGIDLPTTGGFLGFLLTLFGFDTQNVDALADATAAGPIMIFQGNQRTAASPGSIMDQSVRFDASYVLTTDDASGTIDLSAGVLDGLEFTVEYTVFVP